MWIAYNSLSFDGERTSDGSMSSIIENFAIRALRRRAPRSVLVLFLVGAATTLGVTLLPTAVFSQEEDAAPPRPSRARPGAPTVRGPSNTLMRGARPSMTKVGMDAARAARNAPVPPGTASPQGVTTSPGAPPRGQANAPEEDAVSPWEKVALPQEMATGIEFKRPRRGARFSFNLVDADLIELIKIIGNITGKSFILGSKVPSMKATIYAPTKINADEAYQAFLSVLQVNGLTVVPAGRYLKLMPLGDSTSRNTRITSGNVPRGDEIVTRLHRLQHVQAEDLAELLGKFKSPEGDVTVYSPTNMIIITDYGSSIRRLMKLVATLDVPGTGEQVWIEPINHADATELADRIKELFDVSQSASRSSAPPPRRGRGSAPQPAPSSEGQGQEGSISKILPDERTNSLIIVASEPQYLRILELIKRLDVPIQGEGTLHVHKLQHADATELAKTLSALSKGAKQGAKKGESESLFEGNLEISPDKATNSIVIVSSLRDYLSIKSVIEKLDVMQRQVFVEAVVMQVNIEKELRVGVGFHSGAPIGSGDKQSLLYGTSLPNKEISSLAMIPGTLSGLAVGLRGPDLEIPGLPGVSLPSFGVALQAMQTNSDVNVLSTPHILATDNVEASISVGENVPMQQGYNPAGAFLSQAASTMGGTQASSAASMLGGLAGGLGGMGGFGGFSIGRQNIGLDLKLTPHINDDNQVRLEIKIKNSDVKSLDPSLGPSLTQQEVSTTAVVADQQTIVIGGIITDNDVETITKTPVLGDIPILGAVFRSKSRQTKKRNLLIFLTPYIVRNAEDFREIFSHKMAERREFIERYTAFEYHRIDPHLDWSRTNGVIAEMDKVIGQAEQDQALFDQSLGPSLVDHTPKPPIDFSEIKVVEETSDSEDETPIAITPADRAPLQPPEE